MKQLAATFAIVCFFVLAFVGWAKDVPVFICGMRAAAGAIVMYVLIKLAGETAIKIIVSTVTGPDDSQNKTRENRP